MKIVYFEWKDAYGNGGWFNQNELKKCVLDSDIWTSTVGFLIRKTKKELIVCTTWQPESEVDLVEERFCNIHKIPMTWIRNYMVLGNTDRRNLGWLSNEIVRK